MVSRRIDQIRQMKIDGARITEGAKKEQGKGPAAGRKPARSAGKKRKLSGKGKSA